MDYNEIKDREYLNKFTQEQLLNYIQHMGDKETYYRNIRSKECSCEQMRIDYELLSTVSCKDIMNGNYGDDVREAFDRKRRNGILIDRQWEFGDKRRCAEQIYKEKFDRNKIFR